MQIKIKEYIQYIRRYVHYHPPIKCRHNGQTDCQKWPKITEWNNIGCWYYNSHINIVGLGFYSEQYFQIKIFPPPVIQGFLLVLSITFKVSHTQTSPRHTQTSPRHARGKYRRNSGPDNFFLGQAVPCQSQSSTYKSDQCSM